MIISKEPRRKLDLGSPRSGRADGRRGGPRSGKRR